ncbi:hypothetical protein AJ78_08864, partial [Emergomyces pasteurianus Ep9510]
MLRIIHLGEFQHLYSPRRNRQLNMQLTSKLVALMLSFASFTLAAPTESAAEQGKNADDLLACKSGSYRCGGWLDRIE